MGRDRHTRAESQLEQLSHEADGGNGSHRSPAVQSGNTATQLPPYDYEQTVRLESYFGQATADLWNQLFLTAALRDDGASSFGASTRHSWFPKGSAAWTFFRGAEGANRWLTFGKLRAAYGQSGTQPQPYLLASVFNSTTLAEGGFGPASSTQIGGVGGLVTRYNLPTQDLGPERVKEFEAGMDLGLLGDKADFGVTYYRRIPPTSSSTFQWPAAPGTPRSRPMPPRSAISVSSSPSTSGR